jgi:hypothetical protein
MSTFFSPILRRAFVFALLFLALAVAPGRAEVPPLPGQPLPTALFIPLDDRPSTWLFPQQIARIGGGRLRVPSRHLLGRAWTPGRPEDLASWARQAMVGTERALVSVDMLAYGGLVASRTAGCTTEKALARLDVLKTLQRSGIPVVAFAILPRLSLRTSEAQAPYERTLANWAAAGSESPPENVPAEIFEEYLAVRRRNVQVVADLVAQVARGDLEFLVLGQDDAAPRGPHIQEQRLLEEQIRSLGVEERVRIISGADELAMNLVAGWLAGREGLQPVLEILYSEEGAGERIPPMESRPLEETIQEHLSLSGARSGSGRGTVLLVEVPSDKPYEPPALEVGAEDLERAAAFKNRLEQVRSGGRRLGVADLRLVNRADPVLARELLEHLPLWDLEAYAAWNTPSNALGTAVAQAVVREVARARGQGWSLERVLESEKTQQAFTLARLLDDFAYQAVIRPTLSQTVRGLPRDPDPLLNLYGPAGLQARTDTVAWARQVWQERLQGRQYLVPALRRWVEFAEMRLEVVLPWPRVFEIEARLDLRLVPRAGAPPPPFKKSRPSS